MLILIAHGSRNPDWRASVETVVESVTAELGPDALALAYMDCAPPTLDDVVASAAARGIGRVDVLPLFLAAEGHVVKDVYPLVEQARKDHPEIEIGSLPPMGQHDLFRKMLVGMARAGGR